MLSREVVTELKSKAKELGFVALGIASVHPIPQEVQDKYLSTLENFGVGDMGYLERNLEVRFNPDLLVAGARSIIVGAFNYYPKQKQRSDAPQIAYYAYGDDYHKVVKDKLYILLDLLKQHTEESFSSRVFVDSAPLMERYWAVQSGVGRIGRNGLLIVPRFGSFCFLGEIVTTLELPADPPALGSPCGHCMQCVEQCPAQAISPDGGLNPTRCLSYQTIEYHGGLEEKVIAQLGDRVYGCDTCQKVCPHNKFAYPHQEERLMPKSDLLRKSLSEWQHLDPLEFDNLFAKSAVQRVGYQGFRRNIDSLLQKREEETT